MKHLYLIGGIDPSSDLGAIEREMIKSTGKAKPRILYFPTAGGDELRNYHIQEKIFKEHYGCDSEALLLLDGHLSKDDVEKKIIASDIVFIGGGNVKRLMTAFEAYDVFSVLKKANEKGLVIAGMSAGALCWGNRYLESKAHDVIKCHRSIDLMICPHYNKESFQEKVLDFENYVKRNNILGLGLDNNCAVEINDGQYRVIKAKVGVKAYKVYNRKDGIKKITLENEKYQDMNNLFDIEKRS